jgi:hypothetical protein
MLADQLRATRVHVGVHGLDPAHEGGDVVRERRLGHAVDNHPVTLLLVR